MSPDSSNRKRLCDGRVRSSLAGGGASDPGRSEVVYRSPRKSIFFGLFGGLTTHFSYLRGVTTSLSSFYRECRGYPPPPRVELQLRRRAFVCSKPTSLHRVAVLPSWFSPVRPTCSLYANGNFESDVRATCETSKKFDEALDGSRTRPASHLASWCVFRNSSFQLLCLSDFEEEFEWRIHSLFFFSFFRSLLSLRGTLLKTFRVCVCLSHSLNHSLTHSLSRSRTTGAKRVRTASHVRPTLDLDTAHCRIWRGSGAASQRCRRSLRGRVEVMLGDLGSFFVPRPRLLG